VIWVSGPTVPAQIVKGIIDGVGERKCVVLSEDKGVSDASKDEKTTSMRSRKWSRSQVISVKETKFTSNDDIAFAAFEFRSCSCIYPPSGDHGRITGTKEFRGIERPR
jgi:hypothetical protein